MCMNMLDNVSQIKSNKRENMELGEYLEKSGVKVKLILGIKQKKSPKTVDKSIVLV